MKTKHIFFLAGILFLLISLGEVAGQELQKPIKNNPKFHVLLDYHYNLGLANKLQWNSGSMAGHSLHLTALYDFTSRFAAGIGIGPTGILTPISIPSPFMLHSVINLFQVFRKVISMRILGTDVFLILP